MAIGVIDRLEAIEVDQADPARFAGGTVLVERLKYGAPTSPFASRTPCRARHTLGRHLLLGECFLFGTGCRLEGRIVPFTHGRKDRAADGDERENAHDDE